MWRKALCFVVVVVGAMMLVGCATKGYVQEQDEALKKELDSRLEGIAKDLTALGKDVEGFEQRTAAIEQEFKPIRDTVKSTSESLEAVKSRSDELHKVYGALEERWKKASKAFEMAEKQVARNYEVFLTNLKNQRALAETQLRAIEQMLETLIDAAAAQEKAAAEGAE